MVEDGKIEEKHWIHEKLLQKYVKHNKPKWNKYFPDSNIQEIKYNKRFDKFPDLTFLLKDGSEVPVEVEWASSNFIKHEHKIKPVGAFAEFRSKKGLVLVFYEDEELGVRQEVMELDGFKKWLGKNYDKIIDETVREYEGPAPRSHQKLWFAYVPKGSVGNYDIGVERRIWGFPKKNQKRLKLIKEIKEGDLVAFVMVGNKFGGNVKGRPPFKKWHKRGFKGEFEKIQVFRITKGFFEETNWERRIWPVKTEDKKIERNIVRKESQLKKLRKQKGKKEKIKKIKKQLKVLKEKIEVWPYRFKFESPPVVNLEDIIIKKLQAYEKEQLRLNVLNIFMEGDPSTLVECIYHSRI